MQKIDLLFRSILYWIGFLCIVIFYGTLSLPLYFIPYKSCYPFLMGWNRSVMWWLKVTCRLDYKVSGLENISKNKAMIILANHESTWETFSFGAIFPRLTWVAKKSLLYVPFFGWNLFALRPVTINRGNGRQALKQVKQIGKARLDDGTWVVIFPEGTRMKHGTSGKYKAGGALLAKYSGYEVLPVAHNAGKYWAKGSFIKYPGTISIHIGKAISPENLTTKEILQQTEKWIKNEKKNL